MYGPSGHVDTFCRDNLPDAATAPDMIGVPAYPDWLNAGVELSDRLAQSDGSRVALRGRTTSMTYAELAARSDRIAQVLVEDMQVMPGQRVLLYGANTPALVSVFLGILKAGGVAVNVMPQLRAREIGQVISKAKITHALCDRRQIAELERCTVARSALTATLSYDGTGEGTGALDRLVGGKTGAFTAVRVGRDDVALIAFTSGSTGTPKATAHFHRDILSIADTYGQGVLAITSEDICLGTPPVAFAFGLCGLVSYPLRAGATAVLLDDLTPETLAKAIETYGATVCYTSPTAYRRMLGLETDPASLRSLRVAVSAGETLQADLFDAWQARVGCPLLDGIGSTETLSFFISNRIETAVAGATGRPVAPYQARVVDDALQDLPPNTPGRLAVKGPTGCRYLDDPRQGDVVKDGWTLTGDTFFKDETGLFHFVGRADDMIISAGYTIAAPEVEAALLSHSAVSDCAVIGAPDEERGHIVEAIVVLAPGWAPGADTTAKLQAHAKSEIAPYKYPRSIRYMDALPKTPSGKTRRFLLRR
ncbi:MAG: AMP-binding protein [Pseudomonadota bacterium]